jgi:hypothetical protein
MNKTLILSSFNVKAKCSVLEGQVLEGQVLEGQVLEGQVLEGQVLEHVLRLGKIARALLIIDY